MTESVIGRLTVGARAARVIAAELARRPGPKTGLVVGATPDSTVLAAAIDAMLPDDTLTVSASDPAAMRAHINGLGTWVTDRVRVSGEPGGAESADVIMLAELMLGTAEETRSSLDALGKRLNPGGVVAVATSAVPGVAPGAAAELDRQSALYGVGSDLVLRHVPPVRIHRLCWITPDPALAERLTAVDRPSSVPLAGAVHIDSNGVAAAGIALGLAALARVSRPHSKLWLALAAAALPVAAFFRDPRRELPEDDALVVAASDGKVLAVERVTDDRFSGDGTSAEYTRIAVFLSVLDVHVNRSPVAGQVVDYFREDGGYAPAMAPDAEHNVAAYTVWETPHGRVAVAQRTGMLARRIVHRAPVGALLARGERFGLIRFGSRTDVYLPAAAAQPLVGAGDRVVGGTTAIARWR